MSPRTGRGVLSTALAAMALAITLAGCSTVPAQTSVAPAAAVAPAPAATGFPALGQSTPTRVSVPRLGIDSSLVALGLNPDHTVAVPPLDQVGQAGWYRYGPTPGAQGPAVILGHIDGDGHQGVFSNLARMRPGDTIDATRQDGTVAEFTVSHIDLAPKTNFPTRAVYGQTSDAELRLISCGGVLDRQAHSYESNVVVYAVLTAKKTA